MENNCFVRHDRIGQFPVFNESNFVECMATNAYATSTTRVGRYAVVCGQQDYVVNLNFVQYYDVNVKHYEV